MKVVDSAQTSPVNSKTSLKRQKEKEIGKTTLIKKDETYWSEKPAYKSDNIPEVKNEIKEEVKTDIKIKQDIKQEIKSLKKGK